MKKDWYKDIHDMHVKFGFHEAMDKLTPELQKEYLRFRLNFLHEELNEGDEAFDTNDAEGVVDMLVDLIVVAMGTLDVFAVDGNRAWDEVLWANLSKKAGVKASRPNPFNLPDLYKPEGWEAPSHKGNHGLISTCLSTR